MAVSVVLHISGEEPQERAAAAKMAQAIDAIENDDKVRQLIDRFGGRLNVDSVVPRTEAGE